MKPIEEGCLVLAVLGHGEAHPEYPYGNAFKVIGVSDVVAKCGCRHWLLADEVWESGSECALLRIDGHTEVEEVEEVVEV